MSNDRWDGFQSAFEARYGESPDFTVENDSCVVKQLLMHRSHRDFTARAVDSNLLHSLFAAAFSAPSKSDLQQVSVIRLTDEKKREALVKANPAIARLAKAPEFMIWCGDNRRIRLLTEANKKVFANDHLDAFMNAAVDAGIAMQSFIMAAESVGLGCCPVSQVRDNINHLSETLELPQWVFPVAGLAVGWPSARRDVSMRIPNRLTLHENTYDDDHMLEEIQQYDTRREAVRPTPAEAQLHKERFGISENYGWSEQHARQYAVPMRTDFGQYIRKQGFDLS